MRRKIHFLLFLFLCMTSIPLTAQDIEVKGVVTEAATNEPLPGVTVRIKGMADNDGWTRDEQRQVRTFLAHQLFDG